jgi:DNA-binding CsgD family transcriptional regulator
MRFHAGRELSAQAEGLGPSSLPFAELRPGRVYDLDEIVALSDRRVEPGFFEATGIRSGRFMRVVEPGGASACIRLMRAPGEYTAADSSLISAMAPHLSIATRTFMTLARAHFRSAISEAILERAGIGWVSQSEDQRLIDANSLGRAAHAQREAAHWASIPAPTGDGSLEPAAAILLTRQARSLSGVQAKVLADALGISPSEARLAIRLAEGQSLVEAAAALGITTGTARSYSKSLFAKTGTRGQAELVRLVLTNVAALA